MRTSSSQRPAVVLILALLLMGAIIGSSIALSTVISSSNHQSVTVNNYIEASLGADSGLERSLNMLKIGRVDKDIAMTKTAMGYTTSKINVSVTDASTNNNAVYVTRLRPAESYALDVIPAPATMDTLKVTVTCTTTAACGNTKYTVSWIGLDTSFRSAYTGQVTTAPFTGSTPSQTVSNEIHLHDNIYSVTSTDTHDITQPSSSNATGYRIRITATTPSSSQASFTTADDLALRNIIIESCRSQAGGCVPVNSSFQSRLAITSTGTVGASQAKKTVTVPWQPGASGVFNYVLFSEGAIDKLLD